MVPEPMISTPFSAWTLRMENIRSCLRIVDAPSTPISSAIATSSAGVFFFKSFRCIFSLFLGSLGFTEVESAGGRTPPVGTTDRRWMRLTGGPVAIRGMWSRLSCQSARPNSRAEMFRTGGEFSRDRSSERSDDDQDDDD